MFKPIANHVLTRNIARRDPKKGLEWRGIVGTKALGLTSLPERWSPPFVVIGTSLYRQWLETPLADRSAAILQAAQTVNGYLIEQNWAELGLVIRSSAVDESMADRGANRSFELPADYDVQAIVSKIEEIYWHFSQRDDDNEIALVVQSRVHLPYRGHLSNERRVSGTANHWMWEMEAPELADGRFNSQRAAVPDPQQQLLCGQNDRKSLLQLFRMIGRWCTQLDAGRVHIEWGLGFQFFWLLQIDFEDELTDEGVNPNLLLRPAGLHDFEGDLPTGSPIRVASFTEKTGWSKIDKVQEFLEGRTAPYPKLFYVTGNEVEDALASEYDLAADISTVAQNRVVCRTDCVTPGIDPLNLRRTDSVSAQETFRFMERTLEVLKAKGATADDICFIFHNFIPAVAAAWALAKPNHQIVRVDSLWGLPDGLQYLPHDTFEFDIRRDAISAEQIRYKPKFLQETDSGDWRLVSVMRAIARRRSLSLPDLREVARQTHRIAKRLEKPIQIMWFCTIPDEVNIGRNVPWFMMAPESAIDSLSKPIAPDSRRIPIRMLEDLRRASSQPEGRFVLALEPETQLFRSSEFLDEVATVAIAQNFPVLMLGSILSHAYYMLERKGVSVVTDTSGRSRVRQRQVFGKLVRDDIPSRIAEHGERANLAKIAKPESRTALVIKLFEEAQELLKAGSPTEITTELADLLEVVRALAGATGASWDEVQVVAEEKRETRGSFAKNVVLMETSWPSWNERPEQETQRVIPLKDLAHTRGDAGQYFLNFPSVIAKGADNIVSFREGLLRFSVSIVDGGVQIKRVEDDKSDPLQLELPLKT